MTKSTRYALHAVLYMARHPERPVTLAEIAGRYRIPEGALARTLQVLGRAGLVVGTRGVGGRYRLARPAGEITVLDVIELFERNRLAGECLLLEGSGQPCPEGEECRLRRLFDEVERRARTTYASVTLQTLLGPR